MPKVQIKRTSTDGAQPTGLVPGELAIEMGLPTRLWVGVPPAIDPAEKKLLVDLSAVAAAGGLTAPQGRLSLSTTPIMDVTVTAAVAVNYFPYVGDLVPIYNGTIFNMVSVGASLSAPATGLVANKIYDLFIWDNAGVPELIYGLAWTNDTTRAAALIAVKGFWLNSVAIGGCAAQRGTYVGTVRTNASSTFDWIYGTKTAAGGMSTLYVWNAYNRVAVASMVSSNAASWTVDSGSPFQYAQQGSATFRVNYVCGLVDDTISASYSALCYSDATQFIRTAVGHDSVTPVGTNGSVTTLYGCTIIGIATVLAKLGKHYIAALEQAVLPGATYTAANVDIAGLQFSFRM